MAELSIVEDQPSRPAPPSGRPDCPPLANPAACAPAWCLPPSRLAEDALTEAAAAGEPWRTYFEAAADLLQAGFASVQDLDAAAMARKLFAGRGDGLAPGPLAQFVRARN